MSNILKRFAKERQRVQSNFLQECEAAFNWHVSTQYPGLGINEVGASFEAEGDEGLVVMFSFLASKTSTKEQTSALAQSLNVGRKQYWKDTEGEVYGELWMEDYPSLDELLTAYEEAELSRRADEDFMLKEREDAQRRSETIICGSMEEYEGRKGVFSWCEEGDSESEYYDPGDIGYYFVSLGKGDSTIYESAQHTYEECERLVREWVFFGKLELKT